MKQNEQESLQLNIIQLHYAVTIVFLLLQYTQEYFKVSVAELFENEALFGGKLLHLQCLVTYASGKRWMQIMTE